MISQVFKEPTKAATRPGHGFLPITPAPGPSARVHGPSEPHNQFPIRPDLTGAQEQCIPGQALSHPPSAEGLPDKPRTASWGGGALLHQWQLPPGPLVGQTAPPPDAEQRAFVLLSAQTMCQLSSPGPNCLACPQDAQPVGFSRGSPHLAGSEQSNPSCAASLRPEPPLGLR